GFQLRAAGHRSFGHLWQRAPPDTARTDRRRTIQRRRRRPRCRRQAGHRPRDRRRLGTRPVDLPHRRMRKRMPMPDLPSMAFVGFADEGAPIARAIADNGYPLHVWAHTAGTLDALADVPYTRYSSAAALAAASDIVGLSLHDSDNFRVAVDEGLL